MRYELAFTAFAARWLDVCHRRGRHAKISKGRINGVFIPGQIFPLKMLESKLGSAHSVKVLSRSRLFRGRSTVYRAQISV